MGGGGGWVAGSAGTGAESAISVLDDAFPWFDASGEADFPDGQADRLVHLVADGSPARATTSTHNVIDILSWASAVRFSARASEPCRLLVSAGHDLTSYDYFAEREQGRPWPTVEVAIDAEWAEHRALVADMQPPEAAMSAAIPRFFLAFSVEHSGPVEVWLDKVGFE